MTIGRSYPAAAVGSDGRVYSIGGATNPTGLSNTVEAYSPATNTWALVAPMPTPRTGLTAATGPDGRIYAIGGTNPSAPAPLPTVEAYDPRSNTWAPVAPLSVARSYLAAAAAPDGRIYAIGGRDVFGQSNAVEVYDPTKPGEGWKTVAPMPTVRSELAAALGPNGRILVMGGGFNGLTTVEAYTPGPPGSPGSWTTVAPMGTARRALGAAAGPDGRIYAVGGAGQSNLATVEAYTPGPAGTVGNWEPVADMGTGRGALAVTATTGAAERIYAIGGNGGLNTAEAYTPAGSAPPSSTTSTSSTTTSSTTSTTTPPPGGNGPVREYPFPRRDPSGARRPYGITAGPDGNLWFTEQAANKIGRITPAGVITEFALPSRGGPTGITAGPDGNLWFTKGRHEIGRITPTGAVTLYQLPNATACTTAGLGCAQPIDITAGPDGNLWFTEQRADKIGQINPSTGTIKEFAIPTLGGSPTGITSGPDGNLWFTENGFYNPTLQNRVAKIGRITPGGTVTEFPLPTPNAFPLGITAGPDGNLWFTEGDTNKIGRITPGGTITEFGVPTELSGPHDITTGPDGNLWFTEYEAGKVGRMNTAGVATEFPLSSTDTKPLGITTGPDSAMWFAEFGVDRIGRIDPSASPPPACPVAVANTRLGPWATATPMCTARDRLAAARAGDGRIYALGGDGNGVGGFALNIVEAYEPGANRWEQVAPMLTGRSEPAAASGNDGRVYAMGGLGSGPALSPTSGVVPQTEAYDPATNTWAALAPMPSPRFGLAAATGPDGRIYAIGGTSRVGLLSVFTAAVEAYDPRTNSWQRLAPMPTARTGLTAATGPDGRIYAIGGQGQGDSGYLNTVEAYNPVTNSWETLPTMPTGRRGLAATTGPDGRIYAVGGGDNGGATDAAEAYDVGAKRWSSLLPMPTLRSELAAATGPDGRIYALGGRGRSVFNKLNTVEAYDPTRASLPGPPTACSRAAGPPPPATGGTDTWTNVAPIVTPRLFAGSATGPDGCVYVVGGYSSGFDAINTVEAYNPRTNSWETVAPMPTARGQLSVVTGEDGRIYALGGYDGSRTLRTVQAYDPRTNRWDAAASMPDVFQSGAAAAGRDGHIYAFGGFGRTDSRTPSMEAEFLSGARAPDAGWRWAQ